MGLWNTPMPGETPEKQCAPKEEMVVLKVKYMFGTKMRYLEWTGSKVVRFLAVCLCACQDHHSSSSFK